MKIDINKIEKDSLKIKNISDNSYIQSYKEFIKYFDGLDEIKKENLIIGSHLVYGWMPKVLRLNLRQEKEVLQILNEVKRGVLISKTNLETLRSAIGNSMVGVSKLLHFISPKKYAIWDSRVYSYIHNGVKPYDYQIKRPELYLEYLQEMEKVSKETAVKEIQSTVVKACGYKATPFRAIELVMFETGR
jgi:hypothetical protein